MPAQTWQLLPAPSLPWHLQAALDVLLSFCCVIVLRLKPFPPFLRQRFKCPLQVGDTAGDDLDWEGVDDSQARLTALVTMLSPLFRQQTFKAGEHLANQVSICLLCCQRHIDCHCCVDWQMSTRLKATQLHC